MKHLTIILIIITSVFAYAQVGIGTVTPNANSILDLNSSNKGLLLPRVTDTTVVNNPSEGLFLYNINTKAPSYHDGQKWNAIAAAMNMNGSGNDSLTYRFSGSGGMGFSSTALRLDNIAVAGSADNGSYYFSANLTKYYDINTVICQRKMFENTTIGTLEVIYYKQGSATAYKSVKFGSVKFSALSLGLSDKGQDGNGVQTESYSIIFAQYGYKDWVNNQSFYYNFTTNTFGTY